MLQSFTWLKLVQHVCGANSKVVALDNYYNKGGMVRGQHLEQSKSSYWNIINTYS